MSDDDARESTELIRRIERAKRGTPTGTAAPSVYGFALHRGSCDGSRVIMVTTQAGERLPLTSRLLRDLRPHIIRVQGNTPCIMDAPHGHTGSAHEPLDVVEVTTIHRPRSPDGASYTPLMSRLTPRVLESWPAILTVDRRPQGWPP